MKKMNNLQYSVNENSHYTSLSHKEYIDEHAIVAISTFNSYFSIENMNKLFFWAKQNFADFNVFFMDGASVYNLMAMGYDEKRAIQKTRGHDNNLTNKIMNSLDNVGFDTDKVKKKILPLTSLSNNEKYVLEYKKILNLFEQNAVFKNDCLEVTRLMLLSKIPEVTDKALQLAVKYLFAELPLWFNTPYILNVNSSSFVYKDLSPAWQQLCYKHDLLAPNQKVVIKNVTE